MTLPCKRGAAVVAGAHVQKPRVLALVAGVDNGVAACQVWRDIAHSAVGQSGAKPRNDCLHRRWPPQQPQQQQDHRTPHVAVEPPLWGSAIICRRRLPPAVAGVGLR